MSAHVLSRLRLDPVDIELEHVCVMSTGGGGAGGESGGLGGLGGEKSGPLYSTYAVQQISTPGSWKRILAGPAEVSTVTTSGSGNAEKPPF